MRFSRASHSRALFTLLLWFCSVLRVNPVGTWCSWARSARTALNRAGITSSGLSNALAICRKDVVQWRRVWIGSSSAAAMIAMASTKEVSIRMGIAVSIFYGILGIRQCNTDYQYLYQTSQTLTHWRHRLSGPKRRYLIRPTDVSATDVPERRTQHESMSPQVDSTNPQIEGPAAAQSRRAMDMIFHG